MIRTNRETRVAKLSIEARLFASKRTTAKLAAKLARMSYDRFIGWLARRLPETVDGIDIAKVDWPAVARYVTGGPIDRYLFEKKYGCTPKEFLARYSDEMAAAA